MSCQRRPAALFSLNRRGNRLPSAGRQETAVYFIVEPLSGLGMYSIFKRPAAKAAPAGNRTNSAPNAAHLESRVLYLFGLVIVVMFGYPITEVGHVWVYAYLFVYALMIVMGGSIAGDTGFQKLATASFGMTYVVVGIMFVGVGATDHWAHPLGYVMLMLFQLMLIRVLFRYVFSARAVTLATIVAAITIYLMLGALFVPFYGLIYWFLPGSFADSAAPGTAITWQQLNYYSYVTLTSTGYGDILPQSLWARSAATLEAISGVLYITVIMSRLVGIYSSDRRSESGLNL